MSQHETPDRSKYRLYLKSIQGGAIRGLFEVLKEILHDVSLEFDSTGMKLQTMDSARCALVYLRLRAESFEEYHCEGKWSCGVNMLSMFKLVRTTSSHDTICFFCENDATDKLGITIQNAEKNSTTSFKLSLLDVDSEEIRVPDVEFDSVITIPSAYFQRLCRDMVNLSTTMIVKSNGNTLELSCVGDIATQTTIIGEAQDGMSVKSTTSATGTEYEEKYSLNYLTLFCRASSLCNTMQLFLKQSYPLILSYNCASLGELRFVLAPKVND